jgi:hypothetical protein
MFPVGTTVQMDDIKKIPYMIEFAEAWPIDDAVDWLRKTWNAA